MCYWEIALVLGSNINTPMEDKDVPEAFETVQKALILSDKVSEKERQLISTLTKRYASKPLADRSGLDRAYADAMRTVAKAYPKDSDVKTLFAKRLMDLHPWDYWQKNGKPRPWTGEILDTLDEALEIDPYNPGANHLYIHALEAGRPKEAEKVYLEDLKEFPNKWWSLYGLYLSLKAQGKSENAQKVKKRFEESWQWADIKLTVSRF